MWSAEQARQIHDIARSTNPAIKLHAIPEGLQVERGPDAIVEYLLREGAPTAGQLGGYIGTMIDVCIYDISKIAMMAHLLALSLCSLHMHLLKKEVKFARPTSTKSKP